MEQRIKEQLFGTSSVKLQILEEYELSELYTPEAVMEEYKESLILELKEKVDAAETAAAAVDAVAAADIAAAAAVPMHIIWTAIRQLRNIDPVRCLRLQAGHHM